MAIFMEGKKNNKDNSKGLTATSEDILQGKTAEINGEIVTGNMVNRSIIDNDGIGVSVTYPTIPANPNDVNVQQLISTDGVSRIIIQPPKGYYDGGVYTSATSSKVASVTGLTAEKLAKDQTVLGLTGTYTSDATATATEILAGKTAYVNGVKVTGTMTNQGAKTSSLNAGGSYTIPQGYHNGSGKVTANSLASQTSATATAADIAKGKTAYVNGTKLTGTASLAPAAFAHLVSGLGATHDACNCGSNLLIPSRRPSSSSTTGVGIYKLDANFNVSKVNSYYATKIVALNNGNNAIAISDHNEYNSSAAATVYYSTNGGTTWATSKAPTTLNKYPDIQSNGSIFALTNNGVVYTSSNGASWTSTGYTAKNRCYVISGDPYSGYFYDFECVTTTNSTGRVSYFVSVYRSSDCKTWTKIHDSIDTGVSTGGGSSQRHWSDGIGYFVYNGTMFLITNDYHMSSSNNNSSCFSIRTSTNGTTWTSKASLGTTYSYNNALYYYRFLSRARMGNNFYFHQQITDEYIDDSMQIFRVGTDQTNQTITMTTANAPTCIGSYQDKFIKCFQDMIAISDAVS